MSIHRLLLFCLPPVLLAACGQRPQALHGPQTVRVDTVKAGERHAHLQFPGRVKAAQDVTLAFRVSGPIARMHVCEGDRVREGQLLAELDPADYRVQLDATEAEYRQVKAQAERILALYGEKAVTADARDKAAYGLEQIEAKYRHHRDQLEYTRLFAPFDGRVHKRYFAAHETVGAGMPVLSVVSDGLPEVEINLPAAEYVRHEQFRDYYCTLDVYPGVRYALRPAGIAPKANANQLYTMRLQIRPDASQPLPAPGMNAMVTIGYAQPAGRPVAVPAGALLHRDGRTAVFRYDPSDSTVHRLDVTVARLLPDGNAVIEADGLDAGGLVVSSGVHHIEDRERVKPLTPPAPTNIGGLL